MMSSGQKKDLPDVKLFEMMDTLGMEPTGAPVPRFGHMLASAFHTCKSCKSVEQCRNGSRQRPPPRFMPLPSSASTPNCWRSFCSSR